jgi:hypothetical protein
LRPPPNILKREPDEHDERNDGAEMSFDVIEAVTYRLVDVNHVGACAEEKGSKVVLKPDEYRSISGRDYSR